MFDRKLVLGIGLFLLLATPAGADPPRGEFEVHDLSLWISDGAAPTANTRASFSSAFPATVTSSRARSVAASLESGPVGLITFHGSPTAELDVELRIKSGSFLAHWPTGEIAGNRLLWPRKSGITLVDKPDSDSTLLWVDQDHWFQKARQGEALFVRSAVRSERFLAYDAERKLTSPLRLQGGPDKFTVVNDSDSTLYDIVLVRHTPLGVRVAWLDELPKTEAKPNTDEKPKSEGKNDAPKSGDSPAKAEDKGTEKAEEKAKPAVGLFGLAAPAANADAPKVKVDAAQKDAPERKEAPEGQPEKPRVGLFGLAIPKTAETSTKVEPTPLVGGKELVLSDPLIPGSDEANDKTVGELARRLERMGLSAGEIEVFLAQYSSLMFEPEGMIVVCRLDPAIQDAELPLSVFPVPTKIVRVPVLLVRNVDPDLPKQIDQLIADLGDESFARREAAEKQLMQFGSRAFEPLKKAINDKDMEIVIRSERILLNQGQQAAGRQGASSAPTPDKLAKPAAAPAKAK